MVVAILWRSIILVRVDGAFIKYTDSALIIAAGFIQYETLGEASR